MLLCMAAGANGKVSDSFTSVHEAPLHLARGKGHEVAGPPEAVLREIDAQELNRMFVRRYEPSVTSNALCCLVRYVLG